MLYLFRFVNGVPFEVEKLHEPLFTQVQNIIDGKDTRVNINLCPRSGKTTIAIWLVVFIITVCPRAQIIYTSFNQDLLKQISQQIATILTHPVYMALFGGRSFDVQDEEVDPVDDFWREYLFNTQDGKMKFSARKIITPQGGVILFNSIGAAITGFGAGLRGNHKGITGILLCFPYDEYVLTEHGRLKIGEIVEKRLNVRVWSYNFNTGKPELQPIDNWIKNPGDDILEVSQGGNSFRCTPDHRVYTLNRGYVPAQDLTVNDTLACFPNSLDLLERKPRLLHYFAAFYRTIHNKIKNFVRQRFFNSRIMNNATRESLETLACFNTDDCGGVGMVSTGNITNTTGVMRNIDNIGSAQFGTGKYKRPYFNRILHIFRFCPEFKIFKPIVAGVGIQMSRLHTGGRFANKSTQQCPMNRQAFCLGLFGNPKRFITVSITKFKHLFRNHISRPSAAINDISLFASNAPHRRNAVKSFITGNRSPLLVRKVGHTNHSYCLTIRDNHNMYVGKGQGLLVKNCDDADKPTEVRSETIRKKTQTYFVETLFNRLNNSNTPIVNLQQRLHLDDLSGFLTRTYNFKTFKFPLLDAQGNCNLPHQYTQSRIDELKIDNYTFSAQYQQEPIMLGGGLIKHAWWRFYKDQNDTTYRRIFITADTANKTNEWNDFTAIGVWGLTSQNRLRLLDMVHAKMEIPELQSTFLAIWDKWRAGIGTCHCSAIYIEDKASGTQVIQELRRKGGLPILPYVEVKDKLTRVQDALPQIAAGNVELPENDLHPISAEFLAEADAFSADMSHLHDDMVDMMTCAVVQAYNQRGYF